MLKRLSVVFSSFFIMLSLGGVYAWSVVAYELKEVFSFTSTQTQIVFGLLIAVFPVSMLFVKKMEKKLKPRTIILLSGILFFIGYMIAGFSNGNFYLITLGVSVFVGVATGFGYLLALSTPVKWYPNHKGLITGIASAGFGLASVVLASSINFLFKNGVNVLDVFKYIAIVYGVVIVISSFFIKNPTESIQINQEKQNNQKFVLDKKIVKLFLGIFLGTFAGLLVIGNLKSIGTISNLDNSTLIMAVSVFAIANFLGRISWGILSDKFLTQTTIMLALIQQGVSIALLLFIPLTSVSFVLIAFLIGFGFGSNFVLFAKGTAQEYGIENVNTYYPYIFLGYAVAGITGPITGGLIYDATKNYDAAIIIATALSVLGGLIFIKKAK